MMSAEKVVAGRRRMRRKMDVEIWGLISGGSMEEKQNEMPPMT